jgi:hypothetical protein
MSSAYLFAEGSAEEFNRLIAEREQFKDWAQWAKDNPEKAEILAKGDPTPNELITGWAINKYGAQAVYGRAISFHELRMLDLADNIVRAYKERERAEDWAKWAEDNPEKNRLLAHAGKLAQEE